MAPLAFSVESVECTITQLKEKIMARLRQFFARLFAKPPKDQTRNDEERKRHVLSIMSMYSGSEDPFFTVSSITHALYARGLSRWRVAGKDMRRILRELVDAGLIQRIDGGNKERLQSEVYYTITGNGLRYIGLVDA